MSKETMERVGEMSKPLTPKSERRYEGRIAPIGVPDLGCSARKCIRRAGHPGQHYPA